MATRAEERERLRRHRIEREEAARRANSRKQRLLYVLAASVFVALCAVAAMVVISQGQGGGGDTSLEGTGEVESLLAGIPQQGRYLGDPGAAATIVEFGDLQCPVCKAYSTGVVAELIEGPVRAGKARLEFRNWTILGPQSRLAAGAAYAAAEQGRYWSFVELFFRNQGIENTGYVTPEFLRAVARGAGVPDLARWERERRPSRWSRLLGRTSAAASGYGFTGTPSFVVEGPGGAVPLGTPHSAAQVEAAIAQAR